MKGDNKDDDRENETPGVSKNSIQLQRSESDPIAQKLKDIKEQKAHFNDMVQDLQSLVTPVNAKTMTKKSNKKMDQENQTRILDDMPSTSAAARSENTQLIDDTSVQDETIDDEIILADSIANMFVMQADGTDQFFTENSPITEGQEMLAMREILIEDGELIILTGGNGEDVYNPEDTMAIDINDSRIFVVDAQESGVSFVQTSEGQENIIVNNIIEHLPEEQDQHISMDIAGGEVQQQNPATDMDIQLPNGENIADISEQEVF